MPLHEIIDTSDNMIMSGDEDVGEEEDGLYNIVCESDPTVHGDESLGAIPYEIEYVPDQAVNCDESLGVIPYQIEYASDQTVHGDESLGLLPYEIATDLIQQFLVMKL